MKTTWPALVALFFVACAASDPPVDVEAEAAELMRLSSEWSEVAGSGDVDATLAYWADDATMMPPGQPPLRGKEAIRQFVEASASIPGFNVRWEAAGSARGSVRRSRVPDRAKPVLLTRTRPVHRSRSRTRS